MTERKSATILQFPVHTKAPPQERFVPMTGNPENGDCLDYFKSLSKADQFIFTATETPSSK